MTVRIGKISNSFFDLGLKILAPKSLKNDFL